MAIHLKKLGAEPVIVDSLSVNNIFSFKDNDIKNKILYSSILNNRIDLLKKDEIELIIQDAETTMQFQKYIKKSIQVL